MRQFVIPGAHDSPVGQKAGESLGTSTFATGVASRRKAPPHKALPSPTNRSSPTGLISNSSYIRILGSTEHGRACGVLS